MTADMYRCRIILCQKNRNFLFRFNVDRNKKGNAIHRTAACDPRKPILIFLFWRIYGKRNRPFQQFVKELLKQSGQSYRCWWKRKNRKIADTWAVWNGEPDLLPRGSRIWWSMHKRQSVTDRTVKGYCPAETFLARKSKLSRNLCAWVRVFLFKNGCWHIYRSRKMRSSVGAAESIGKTVQMIR